MSWSGFVLSDDDDGGWFNSTFYTVGGPDVGYTGGIALHGFCRFDNVGVELGETINSAVLRLQMDTAQSSGNVSVTIYGNDSDDPSAVSSAADANARPHTSATALYISGSSSPGDPFVELNVTNIVRELVARSGWVINNAIQFLLLGHNPGGHGGDHEFYGADSFGTAGELIINSTPPDTGGGGGGGDSSDPGSDTDSSSTTAEPDESSVPCLADPIHVLGRRQIGVDQQQGGTYYPFLDPSDDLDLLIGDLYLNYLDDGCELTYPLKIDWLAGFGCEGDSGFAHVHDYDLQISDADDQVVYNTNDSVTFSSTDWGSYLRILEWTNNTAEILRVVIYTAWDETASQRTWADYFEPTKAELDPRSTQVILRQVRALSIETTGDDELVASESNLVITSGYNVKTSYSQLETSDGGPFGYEVVIDVVPGAGLGRFPGCADSPVLRQINQAVADTNGNLVLDAEGCLRLERPILGQVPATAEAFRQLTLIPAALKLSNDCGPCCTCDDYVAVYEAIRRLNNRYQSLGARAEAVRDLYSDNVARWNAQKTCRAAGLTRVVLQPVIPGRMAVAAGLCNSTDGPMLDVELQLAFSGATAGCVVCNTTLRRGNVELTSPSPSPNQFQAYQLTGSWPNYSAFFDCINPGSVGQVTFLLHFEGGNEGDVVDVDVTPIGDDVGGATTTSNSKTLVTITSDPDCCEPGSL